MNPINLETACRLVEIVDTGLTAGLGIQEPGKMCVEAAVCFALGLPHSDNPPCVGWAVREFKMRLNDSNWSSIEARARGMRRLAVAQIGSDEINNNEFSRRILEKTIRVLLPRFYRKFLPNQFVKEVDLCESEGTQVAAWNLYTTASGSWIEPFSQGEAGLAAAVASRVAARVGAPESALAVAAVATAAAWVASRVAWRSSPAGAARASSEREAADAWLVLSADLAFEVLQEMNAPGVALWNEFEDWERGRAVDSSPAS